MTQAHAHQAPATIRAGDDTIEVVFPAGARQLAKDRGNDQQHDMPVQLRVAQLVPTTYRAEDNTIEVVWTTGSRRRAYDWYNDQVYEEELAVTPDAVDMTRFEAGTVQVIDSHNTYSGVSAILGIAVNGRIADGEGLSRIALSTDPAKAGVVGDIKAGIIRAMSFGYSVEKYEVTQPAGRTDGGTLPLYRAVRWTPQEITFCPVGADPEAAPRAGDFPELARLRLESAPRRRNPQTRESFPLLLQRRAPRV